MQFQRAYRRLPSGLVIFNSLWFTSKQQPWGTERIFYLFDKKCDRMVPVAMQDLLTTTSGSTQTYTSKTSWNNSCNTVETIGGGGAGAIGASTTTGGGGGGGGAYNRISNFSFATPGTTTATYAVQAGLLHTGTYPGTAPDTWFNGSTLAASSVGSKGGVSPATSTTATGAAGGATSGGVPTTSPPARAGGTGGNGASQTAGGGGGGAGGFNGAGGNGSGTTGGTANGGLVAGGSPGNPGTNNSGHEWDSTHGCGSGGGGSNASAGTGGAGGNYGGGAGGGSRSTGVGGNGAQGIIALQAVFPDFADISRDNAAVILRTIEAVPYQ
jgi:hypothetical protein